MMQNTSLRAPATAPLRVVWNYASTSYFRVQDPNAFRAFLSKNNVYFNDRGDEFMLIPMKLIIGQVQFRMSSC
jgi:hypothetical protein